MSVIIDASIVVKWYVPEPDWNKAQTLAESENDLAAPIHILGEVGEVLVRRFRESKITERHLALARDSIPDALSFISLTGTCSTLRCKSRSGPA